MINFTATVTFSYSIDPDEPGSTHVTTDPDAMAALHQADWQDDPVTLRWVMAHFGYKVTVVAETAA